LAQLPLAGTTLNVTIHIHWLLERAGRPELACDHAR
jgi:hypothetical protein